jgi:hypothetical protein
MSVEEIKVGNKSFIKWTEIRRVRWHEENNTINNWQETGWSFLKLEPKEKQADDSVIHFSIVTLAGESKPRTPDQLSEKSKCAIM